MYGSTGQANGGALIGDLAQNSNGDWIMGFCRKLGATSGLATKIWALRDVLQLLIMVSTTYKK